MLKLLNNLLIFSLFVSCSGIKVLPNKAEKIHEERIIVHPGKIIQILLPENTSESKIKCTNGYFPVAHNKQPYFIYAESYFSDMKDKKCEAKNIRINIKVVEKKFPYEELKVDTKRVNLNEKDLARVLKEREILSKVYANKRIFFDIDSNFQLPIDSKITSDYGKKRLFNKQRKGQHLGIDFRAKVGKEIMAANDGKVVLAQDLFYTGNTVILYHGLGIFTVYGHLSKIHTMKNSVVKKGDMIGLAGMTGRVTGPHLHWGVKVNGEWVNGRDLLNIKIGY